jgi:sugar-specific transcriptional regulator TrmB
MSLKEFTKEVFTRYGFTEEHINIYLAYLRVPRATISEVFMTLGEEHEGLEYQNVLEITEWLEERGFLKKIEGIVPRYIPLEPFFELFTNESETLRNEIAKIKDTILTDQSSRFEKLENIQNKSVSEIENAVDSQVKAFFEDSDTKNSNKKNKIDKATNRFTAHYMSVKTKLKLTIQKTI